MKTYYLVKSIIRDTHSIMRYEGSMECEEKPRNTFTSNEREDVYEDWFETEGQALQFVRDNKKYL